MPDRDFLTTIFRSDKIEVLYDSFDDEYWLVGTDGYSWPANDGVELFLVEAIVALAKLVPESKRA